MNYGELKNAIIDDTHRSDLTMFVPRFVRGAEGLIRRQLRGYVVSTTLTESDRVSDGVYNLPARLLEIRSLSLQGRQGDSLNRVGSGQIRRLDTTTDVVQYAQLGDSTIEFRGIPDTGAVFDLLYFGSPAPLTDEADENTLLTDHETLYMSGAKFFLYQHTQDLELAKVHLDIFQSVVETLNEQVARQIGGASIAPTYNFSGGAATNGP